MPKILPYIRKDSFITTLLPVYLLGNDHTSSEHTNFVPFGTRLRQVKYLNNIVEQDHRFIKRRVKPGLGFFSFETAWNTLQGYESMNIIRKGQVHGVEKGDIMGQVAFIARLFRVAA
jgi:transposase, IS6 family